MAAFGRLTSNTAHTTNQSAANASTDRRRSSVPTAQTQEHDTQGMPCPQLFVHQHHRRDQEHDTQASYGTSDIRHPDRNDTGIGRNDFHTSTRHSNTTE